MPPKPKKNQSSSSSTQSTELTVEKEKELNLLKAQIIEKLTEIISKYNQSKAHYDNWVGLLRNIEIDATGRFTAESKEGILKAIEPKLLRFLKKLQDLDEQLNKYFSLTKSETAKEIFDNLRHLKQIKLYVGELYALLSASKMKFYSAREYESIEHLVEKALISKEYYDTYMFALDFLIGAENKKLLNNLLKSLIMNHLIEIKSSKKWNGGDLLGIPKFSKELSDFILKIFDPVINQTLEQKTSLTPEEGWYVIIMLLALNLNDVLCGEVETIHRIGELILSLSIDDLTGVPKHFLKLFSITYVYYIESFQDTIVIAPDQYKSDDITKINILKLMRKLYEKNLHHLISSGAITGSLRSSLIKNYCCVRTLLASYYNNIEKKYVLALKCLTDAPSMEEHNFSDTYSILGDVYYALNQQEKAVLYHNKSLQGDSVCWFKNGNFRKIYSYVTLITIIQFQSQETINIPEILRMYKQAFDYLRTFVKGGKSISESREINFRKLYFQAIILLSLLLHLKKTFGLIDQKELFDYAFMVANEIFVASDRVVDDHIIYFSSELSKRCYDKPLSLFIVKAKYHIMNNEYDAALALLIDLIENNNLEGKYLLGKLIIKKKIMLQDLIKNNLEWVRYIIQIISKDSNLTEINEKILNIVKELDTLAESGASDIATVCDVFNVSETAYAVALLKSVLLVNGKYCYKEAFTLLIDFCKQNVSEFSKQLLEELHKIVGKICKKHNAHKKILDVELNLYVTLLDWHIIGDKIKELLKEYATPVAVKQTKNLLKEETPSKLEQQGDPIATVSSADVPATVSSADVPATVSSADVPATVSSADAPATVSSADAPATVSSADVPATVSSVDVPATVSSADVPATVSLASSSPDKPQRSKQPSRNSSKSPTTAGLDAKTSRNLPLVAVLPSKPKPLITCSEINSVSILLRGDNKQLVAALFQLFYDKSFNEDTLCRFCDILGNLFKQTGPNIRDFMFMPLIKNFLKDLLFFIKNNLDQFNFTPIQIVTMITGLSNLSLNPLVGDMPVTMQYLFNLALKEINKFRCWQLLQILKSAANLGVNQPCALYISKIINFIKNNYNLLKQLNNISKKTKLLYYTTMLYHHLQHCLPSEEIANFKKFAVMLMDDIWQNRNQFKCDDECEMSFVVASCRRYHAALMFWKSDYLTEDQGFWSNLNKLYAQEELGKQEKPSALQQHVFNLVELSLKAYAEQELTAVQEQYVPGIPWKKVDITIIAKRFTGLIRAIIEVDGCQHYVYDVYSVSKEDEVLHQLREKDIFITSIFEGYLKQQQEKTAFVRLSFFKLQPQPMSTPTKVVQELVQKTIDSSPKIADSSSQNKSKKTVPAKNRLSKFL